MRSGRLMSQPRADGVLGGAPRALRALLWILAAAPACRCGAPPPPGPGAAVAPLPPGVRLTREAEAALQAGRTEEALERARAASDAEPRSVLAQNQAGRAAAARFARTGDPADAALARSAFEQALALDPGFWPALQNLGELEEARGDRAGAIAAYRRLLVAQPSHPERARLEALVAGAGMTDQARAPGAPALRRHGEGD